MWKRARVIALFLRREGRYKEAIEVVRGLINQYPARLSLSASKKPTCARTTERECAPSMPTGRFSRKNAKPWIILPKRGWNWLILGWATRLRGQRHFGESAQAYEQAAWAKDVGPELKIRSLLAAGECRDLNGDRPLAVRDYQAAIDAGPTTSRADTARKYLHSPYRGNFRPRRHSTQSREGNCRRPDSVCLG